MEADIPLLSVCIPTYNRAEILKETLIALVNDPAFNSQVEIIISDNASNDHTEEVCRSFILKYKNIFYYRNIENIKDRNFYKVLSYANGLYIRLFNDTLRFKTGKLSEMLTVIKLRSLNTHLLFFQNNILYTNCTKEIENLNSFLSIGSFFITWIANFGVWKNDFDRLKEYDKYADLQLVQVDWLLQLASWNEKISISFDDWFEVKEVAKKGGYNIFHVFIVNYFKILRSYFDNFFKCFFLLEIEKYRLFKYFIVIWYEKLIIREEENFSFEIQCANKIIYSEYWYCLYFYLFLFYVYLKPFAKKVLSWFNLKYKVI